MKRIINTLLALCLQPIHDQGSSLAALNSGVKFIGNSGGCNPQDKGYESDAFVHSV